MTPKQFRSWRKGLDLKQREAADLLGLKKRMIQYYETGERNGAPVEIPRYIRLAAYAISHGVRDFDGETPTKAAKSAPDAPPRRVRKTADTT